MQILQEDHGTRWTRLYSAFFEQGGHLFGMTKPVAQDCPRVWRCCLGPKKWNQHLSCWELIVAILVKIVDMATVHLSIPFARVKWRFDMCLPMTVPLPFLTSNMIISWLRSCHPCEETLTDRLHYQSCS